MHPSLSAVLFYCIIVGINGYAHYKTKIPNGEAVPYPCNLSVIWNGVGHHKMGGGGSRNAFGIDFKNAGNVWTKELCQKDSDGDGQSNGSELGDPDCVWKVGATPNITDPKRITHPAICEPVNSQKCKTANKDFDLTCSAAHRLTKIWWMSSFILGACILTAMLIGN